MLSFTIICLLESFRPENPGRGSKFLLYAVSAKQRERSSKVAVPKLCRTGTTTLTIATEMQCGVLGGWRGKARFFS